MKLGPEHYQSIDAAINDIRAIEARDGVTRDSLSAIQQRLMNLAARVDLFTLENCRPPEPGSQPSNYLYRLHEDDDHRFGLYESPVRIWREHRGLNVQALALAAEESAPYVSQIESNKCQPTDAVLERNASAQAVELDGLA